jgi:hypothetical protein
VLGYVSRPSRPLPSGARRTLVYVSRQPAQQLPADDSPAVQLAAEKARHGVTTHLTVGGERVAVIVPESAHFIGRLLMALLSDDETALVLLRALPDVFPWVRFLPSDDVKLFSVELVKTAQACAEPDNMAPLEAVIAAWHHTAEVYADPGLRDELARPLDGVDYGAVSDR